MSVHVGKVRLLATTVMAMGGAAWASALQSVTGPLNSIAGIRTHTTPFAIQLVTAAQDTLAVSKTLSAGSVGTSHLSPRHPWGLPSAVGQDSEVYHHEVKTALVHASNFCKVPRRNIFDVCCHQS